jgi:hypothetical protein
MNSTNVEVQCNAVGCITNLATHEDNKAKIAKSGALGPLTRLAKSKDMRVQRNATGALLNMTHSGIYRSHFIKVETPLTPNRGEQSTSRFRRRNPRPRRPPFLTRCRCAILLHHRLKQHCCRPNRPKTPRTNGTSARPISSHTHRIAITQSTMPSCTRTTKLSIRRAIPT